MINGWVIYESEFGDDRQGTSKTIKTDPFSLSIRADSSSSNEDMRKCNGMFVFFEIASSDSWVGSVTSIPSPLFNYGGAIDFFNFDFV